MNADAAYAQCEAITRREAKNFAYGIRLLKPPERQALSAVYALARRIDDIGDGDAPAAQRSRSWPPSARTSSRSRPRPTTRCSPPSPTPPARYGLPMAAFGELIDGCEHGRRGVVLRHHRRPGGLLPPGGRLGRPTVARRVRGGRPSSVADPLADDLGVALQLTNILRDIVEDGEHGPGLPARPRTPKRWAARPT